MYEFSSISKVWVHDNTHEIVVDHELLESLLKLAEVLSGISFLRHLASIFILRVVVLLEVVILQSEEK